MELQIQPAAAGKSASASQFESRRMDLLRRCAIVFAEDGYYQTSVNSLAERLGVSKPVLYYYTKNKDDLLFQCGEIARTQLRAAMDSAQRIRMSGVGQLRRFFVTYAEVMCGDFGRCLALVDHRSLSAEARKKDVAVRRDLELSVRQMVLDGQADGSIGQCDPTLTARALFGAFNGIPRWFDRNGVLDAKDVAESYLDAIINGIGRPYAHSGS